MNKIVHVVGTSGAGKSYAVRAVMSRGTDLEPQLVPDRANPIGYRLHLPDCARAVFVAGYYGPAGTGGCDTIKDVNTVFALVEEHWRQGCCVIYEGLFTMNHTRGPLLARAVGPENFCVVKLTGTLQECLTRVDQRRALKGEGKLADRHNAANAMKNLSGTYKRAANYASKMKFLGCCVYAYSSSEAPDRIVELLRGD